VVLSVAVHLLAFAGFQKAFPSLLGPAQARLYRLELIRPPVEDLPQGEEPGSEEARLGEEPETEPETPLEDTISLNTRDSRYVDYARVIKERLLAHWSYPPQARVRLLEGRLLLVFTLSPGGEMTSIRVLDHSGHEILDNEACRAVRSAAPFPPFPEHVRVQRLNVRAAFDYRLTSR
jgi:TonB family protein